MMEGPFVEDACCGASIRDNPAAAILGAKRIVDSFSKIGDPVADQVAMTLSGSRRMKGVYFLESVLEAKFDPGLDHNEKISIDRFLEELESPPSFDSALIAAGQRVFLRNGALSALALFLSGLVEVFARPTIAEILRFSGRSATCPRARILQTARLVSDLMRPRSLSGNTLAVRQLVQVRLGHSFVRNAYRAGTRGSSVVVNPISQGDLLFTLLGFSILVLRGLVRLGVKVTEEEQEAYFYLWRCAAWFLGIESEILPMNLVEAWDLYAELSGQSVGQVNCYSRDLVARSIQAMSFRSPVYLSRAVLHSICRRLIGDSMADELDLGRHRSIDVVVAAIKPMIWLTSSTILGHPKIERSARFWGWRFARQSGRLQGDQRSHAACPY